MDPLEEPFDIIIIETGLTQSILAAALSKAGHRVLHLDSSDYYGSGAASLTLDELLRWVDSQSTSTRTPYHSLSIRLASSSNSNTLPPELQAGARHYSISLSPSLALSGGLLVNHLVQSDVAKYGGFRLLDMIGIVESSTDQNPAITLRRVPSSKEDVFRDAELTLLEKRKLMRLLQFAGGAFEESDNWQAKRLDSIEEYLGSHLQLSPPLVSAMIFAVGLSSSPREPAESYFTRLRNYLRSAGRYGKSPFLLGHYGGLGEIAQGFCRMAAVNGATYALGRSLKSLSRLEADGNGHNGFQATIEGLDRPVRAAALAAPPHALQNIPDFAFSAIPEHTISTFLRGVVILDRPLTLVDSSSGQSVERPDTMLIVFPPGSVAPPIAHPVFCLLTGEGSFSTPKGKSLVYMLTMASEGAEPDPAAVLRPYVDGLLTLNAGETRPIIHLELFYAERVLGVEAHAPTTPVFPVLSSPPLTATLAETGDNAAAEAERLYWEISTMLCGDANSALPTSVWGPRDDDAEDAEW